MKEIIKLGLVLLTICVIAALALGFTNESTKDRIDFNIKEANRLARIEVFPEATDFVMIANRKEKVYESDEAKSLLENHALISEVYEAQNSQSEKIGYIITTKPEGYGGSIDVIVGFTLDGNITGMRVGAHQETPGLGAKATTESFYSQYENLSADGQIGVIKEVPSEGENAVQAITSATITTVAITDGVNLSNVVLQALK
jgi:electron transport complex protein RnfG